MQTRELGGSTCEYNKPSMRSTASPGLGACQWASFSPFRNIIYFLRLESKKTDHTICTHTHYILKVQIKVSRTKELFKKNRGEETHPSKN